MTSISEKDLVLVGIVTSLDHDAGWELIGVAERFDGMKLGSCVIVEANMDALALLDTAKKNKARRIVLIAGLSREDMPQGLQHYYTGKPGQERIPLSNINRLLWANLTGSLDVDDYINALRILSDKPYDIYVCNKVRGDGVNCAELAEKLIKKLCVDIGDRK